MKLFYPYPTIFESDPTELMKHSHSVAMLALTPDKHIEIVQELFNPSVWRSFWTQVPDKELDYITIDKDPNDDPKNITWISNQIVEGLEYIIKKGYIFIGLLHLGPHPYDKQIIEDRSWFKRKNKYLENMLSNYHEREQYPSLNKEEKSIYTQFIGTGEKFFRHSESLEKLNLQQLSQMSGYFRGNLCGIFGTNTVSKKIFQFVILSQNITKEKTLKPLSLDKKGRNTVEQLIKNKQFSPTGGFKLSYGIWALRNLPQWRSMELLKQFSEPISKYNQYLQALMAGKPSPYKDIVQFLPKDPFHKEETPEVIPSAEELFGEPIKPKTEEIKQPEMQLTKVSLPWSKETPEAPQPVSDINTTSAEPELPKIKLTPISKISIPQKKSTLNVVSTANLESTSENGSTIEREVTEDVYVDVFNQPMEEAELFGKADTSVMDPNNMDNIIKAGTAALEGDLGDFGAINPSLMTQQDIFKDLEASLAAMSELDDLAHEDEAVSRVFYPPPTLISFANKEGMQIGGSVCMVSMGVGRNIWMIPELKRMQMWANFWSQEEVEGNPQIKDFIAMEDKDIESAEELENVLQKAFIRIRRNNQIFIGLAEIEGNGFENGVFDELEISSSDIQKLMDIHQKRRTNTVFPEISQDSWIEMQYFGKPETIHFLTNPNSPGALDIASDSVQDPRFQKGKICGIICVDEEAAYLFILVDNLQDLTQEATPYPIDEETLQKMYSLIESAKLTPVSWCKIAFGFQSFESLFLWEEVNEGVIAPLIREKYDQYIQKMLMVKRREDHLRLQVEAVFPDLTEEEEQTSEHAIKCPSCGTENPEDSNFCVACGNKIG